MTRIVLATSVLALSAAVPALADTVPFSADVVQHQAGRDVRYGRMHIGPAGSRFEYQERGRPVVQIMLPQKNLMRVLFPLDRTYVELKLPEGTPSPEARPAEPCKPSADLECRREGEATLGGIKTERWTLRPVGSGTPVRIWWDKSRRMPVRQESPEGHLLQAVMLGTEKIDNREVERWETYFLSPSGLGGRSLALYAPDLKMTLVEIDPSGAVREMRNVTTAAPDAQLFEVPQGYTKIDPPPMEPLADAPTQPGPHGQGSQGSSTHGPGTGPTAQAGEPRQPTGPGAMPMPGPMTMPSGPAGPGAMPPMPHGPMHAGPGAPPAAGAAPAATAPGTPPAASAAPFTANVPVPPQVGGAPAGPFPVPGAAADAGSKPGPQTQGQQATGQGFPQGPVMPGPMMHGGRGGMGPGMGQGMGPGMMMGPPGAEPPRSGAEAAQPPHGMPGMPPQPMGPRGPMWQQGAAGPQGTAEAAPGQAHPMPPMGMPQQPQGWGMSRPGTPGGQPQQDQPPAPPAMPPQFGGPQFGGPQFGGPGYGPAPQAPAASPPQTGAAQSDRPRSGPGYGWQMPGGMPASPMFGAPGFAPPGHPAMMPPGHPQTAPGGAAAASGRNAQ